MTRKKTLVSWSCGKDSAWALHVLRQDDAGDLAGQEYDHHFLGQLPGGADPCGENGEFHTFVHDAPCFDEPAGIRVGDVVERDGFVFADVLPVHDRPVRGEDARV